MDMCSSDRGGCHDMKRGAMMDICQLWDSTDETVWERLLAGYWSAVKPDHLEIERELASLDPNKIRAMGPDEWYAFLSQKYFFWKFTAPNRYATTTKQLQRHRQEQGGMGRLFHTKESIFLFDRRDAKKGIQIVQSPNIRGLGVAGASGLLSLLFPEDFGTVDQFVIEELQKLDHLPENVVVQRMDPACAISPDNAAILIGIMRRKAQELNTMWGTNKWTPRKIDMILWSIRAS